jgi:F-type H+-transporting ATPase subunit c
MLYAVVLAACTVLALPLAVISCATGQSRAAAAALEAIGRQPEAARDIQTNLIIGLAMIESLAIYVLLVFIILQGRLPPASALLSAAGAPLGH